MSLSGLLSLLRDLLTILLDIDRAEGPPKSKLSPWQCPYPNASALLREMKRRISPAEICSKFEFGKNLNISDPMCLPFVAFS